MWEKIPKGKTKNPLPLMLGTCYITQISAAAPDVRYWRKLTRKIYRQLGKGKRVGRREVATKSNRPRPSSPVSFPTNLPLRFFLSFAPFGWRFVYVQSQNIPSRSHVPVLHWRGRAQARLVAEEVFDYITGPRHRSFQCACCAWW